MKTVYTYQELIDMVESWCPNSGPIALADSIMAELTTAEGITLAHVAAYLGRLPSTFTRWHLADNNKTTVAHIAAEFGHLPEGFDQWTLVNEYGWTVAHEAARRGCLPESFVDWDLTDILGRTVRDIYNERTSPYSETSIKKDQGSLKWLIGEAVKDVNVTHTNTQYGKLTEYEKETIRLKALLYAGKLPADFNEWSRPEKGGGSTLAHLAAREGLLPDDFDQWEIENQDGWTVAHEAAWEGHLPDNFNRWDLSDNTDWTVTKLSR